MSAVWVVVHRRGQEQRPVEVLKALTVRQRPSPGIQYFPKRSLSHESRKRKKWTLHYVSGWVSSPLASMNSKFVNLPRSALRPRRATLPREQGRVRCREGACSYHDLRPQIGLRDPDSGIRSAIEDDANQQAMKPWLLSGG